MKLLGQILYFIVRPPSYLVLTLFTCVFFFLIFWEVSGAGKYPEAYTWVYISVLLGVSASNLLKHSRWMR